MNIEDIIKRLREEAVHPSTTVQMRLAAMDAADALTTLTEETPAAWMYPSDLERFESSETFAHAYSIKVGSPNEDSLPLYRSAWPQLSIARAVDRFLAWQLPAEFHPDCYIKFDRNLANASTTWPIGTNLFTADQAKGMFEHCLKGYR